MAEENLKLFSYTAAYEKENRNVLFGMDIGGTLTKMVYYEPDNPTDVEGAMIIRSFVTSSVEYGLTGIRDEHFEYYCPLLGGKLHFLKFHTSRMDAFLQLVKENKLTKNIRTISATGGGAHKFERDFQEQLNISLRKCDEMVSLIEGGHFLLTTSMNQLFHLEKPNFSEEMKKVPFPLESKNLAPYLLVNIGSGISILLVKGPNDFERVGGSSIGGSTFLALSRLLSNATSFDEALAFADKGDSTNVDMLVRDIYGGDYAQFGLTGTTVASSFGKMIHPKNTAAPEDYSKAALLMVTNNICSIAYLQAKLHGVDKVIFAGNFLENNTIAMRTIAFGMEYWSQQSVRALFLGHIGYSGAVGALISTIKNVFDEQQ